MSEKKTDSSAAGDQQLPAHASPYPLSRLAPQFDLVDMAREIQEADRVLNLRASAKLQVIAEQIKVLQAQARTILNETQRDQMLHRAECHFTRRPNQIYYLYRRPAGSLYFSLLSLRDWQNQPPHEFVGAYRLEADMSWVLVDE
jgi:hypothetical protein